MRKSRTNIMSEFKFSCPSCKQNIKIGAEFEGRKIDCPSCNTPLIIPAPPKAEGEVPAATLVQPKVEPVPVASPAPAPAPKDDLPRSAEVPSTPDTPFASPEGDKAEVDKSGIQPIAKPTATVAPITDTRVPVLTPEIKLKIVRDVRTRLADKSHWLPGKKGAGLYNYAARREDDALVPVIPTDASATHYSLFGAVLVEFHRRNVGRVTAGRRKFLDEELTAVIQELLGAESGKTPSSEAQREVLTHEQCLAVLDILEKRCRDEIQAAQKRQGGTKIKHIRLADIVSKLEKDNPLKAEEVACALYYELEELKQRLDELEESANSSE